MSYQTSRLYQMLSQDNDQISAALRTLFAATLRPYQDILSGYDQPVTKVLTDIYNVSVSMTRLHVSTANVQDMLQQRIKDLKADNAKTDQSDQVTK